jgi:hypothetical protein
MLPLWIRNNSRLLKSVEKENFIPIGVDIKEDDLVRNIEDLKHVMENVKYFDMDIPLTVYIYISSLSAKEKNKIDKLFLDFINSDSLLYFIEKENLNFIPSFINNKKDDGIYIETAVKKKNFFLVKLLLEENYIVTEKAIENSLQLCCLDIIDLFKEKGYFSYLDVDVEKKVMSIAVENGNFECVKELEKRGTEVLDNIFESAIRYGNLEYVKELEKRGREIPDNICELAIRYGNLHILKYGHSIGKPIILPYSVVGDLSPLIYCMNNGITNFNLIYINLIDNVEKFSQLHDLEEKIIGRTSWGYEIYEFPMSEEMLDFLLSKKPIFYSDPILHILLNKRMYGNFSLLINKGVNVSNSLITRLIMEDRKDILNIIHAKNPISWTLSHIYTALGYLSKNCIAFMADNGCPFHKEDLIFSYNDDVINILENKIKKYTVY